MKTATRFGLAAAAVLWTGAVWAGEVGQNVAQVVAGEAVEQFFPGEGWGVADVVPVKDGDGETAAWAFVFGNAEFGGGVRELAAAGDQDGTDGESELYVGTATVVTGAKDTDSLVFRTFRGLADWYQEGARGGWNGEAVRLGPGDIRWAENTPAGSRAPGKGAAIRKAARARAAAAAEERGNLPEELKGLAAEADAEAAAAAKGRWAAAAAEARRAERKAALKAAGLAE